MAPHIKYSLAMAGGLKYLLSNAQREILPDHLDHAIRKKKTKYLNSYR